jgi:hypothetical protein
MRPAVIVITTAIDRFTTQGITAWEGLKSSIEIPWRSTRRDVVGRFLLKDSSQSGNIEWGTRIPLRTSKVVTIDIEVS